MTNKTVAEVIHFIEENKTALLALPWQFRRYNEAIAKSTGPKDAEHTPQDEYFMQNAFVNTPVDAYVERGLLTRKQNALLEELNSHHLLDSSPVNGQARYSFIEPLSAFRKSHAEKGLKPLIPLWEIIRQKYWEDTKPLVDRLMTFPTARKGIWSFGLHESRGPDKTTKEETLKECHEKGVLDKIPNARPEGYRFSLLYKKLLTEHERGGAGWAH